GPRPQRDPPTGAAHQDVPLAPVPVAARQQRGEAAHQREGSQRARRKLRHRALDQPQGARAPDRRAAAQLRSRV
ncbi:MAG: hypothetical protein AVDCRST_MAG85-146, partial [uncultured Solirubrobacteraceae bacterium]